MIKLMRHCNCVPYRCQLLVTTRYALRQMSRRKSAVIGHKIRELRRRVDPRMTQKELAHLAGVSVATIAALEGGRYESAEVSTLDAIAKALKVPLSELLDLPIESGETQEFINEFIKSPWYAAVRPSKDDLEWLRATPRIVWMGVRPTPEAIAEILKWRQRHQK
jgi:transcriptional regulator with XRE-family HTH domain